MKGSVRNDGGSWLFVVDTGVDPATGRRRQIRRRGFRTKREAEDALSAVLKDARAGSWREPSDQRLDAYLTEWLAAIRPSVKPSTWLHYETRVRLHIVPRIGALRLRQLDGARLTALYADLLDGGRRNGGGGGLAPRTVLHVHRTLHRALRDAVRWRKLVVNPAELADPPRAVDREMKVWDAEQLRAFLEFVTGDRLRAVWVVAATTGLRRGELAGLRWVDVDLDGGRLSVRRNRVAVGYEVVEGEPKSGRARVVALDPTTVSELRAHRTRQLEERLAAGPAWQETGFVFAREDGTPVHPYSFTQAFENRVRAAGLPRIRLHDLRHGHATLALAAGVPARVMQERLGHADIGITLGLYTHVLPGMQEAAAAQVAALVFGGSGAPG